ncbi:MAG TPA: hypothetical protein VI455_04475 [Terriglobia bacterium]
MRRTTRIAPAAVPPPPVETSARDLVERLQRQQQTIQTLTATAELEPTAGSVYSGVIKQYHDVRAFILLRSPDHLRMEGQAPVVRTTIFDMASDGKEFRVSIPPKGKFIVGSVKVTQPAKNSLENLRPQHILDALLMPTVNSEAEQYFLSQEREQARFYDVLNLVVSAASEKGSSEGHGQLALSRRIWFDASTLEVSRVEFYDGKGALTEDVHYADYRDYEGVRYPSHIELDRPAEDYSLGIMIEKATFNQPIPADKFVLEKPANAEEIRLDSASSRGEGSGGQ